MRRVVIEVFHRDVSKLGRYTAELSQEVESLEVIHHIKHGERTSAIICRVKPKGNDKKNIRELSFKFKNFELLSEQDDGLIVYVEAGTSRLAPSLPNPPKVFLNFPFEILGEKRRVTFTGDEPEIRKLFRWLELNRIEFKVLSNSDASSSPNPFLDGLSDQQRKAVILAYASGYYQLPRKVKMEELARRQRVNKSTFAEHLMKAENYLISRLLEDQAKSGRLQNLPH